MTVFPYISLHSFAQIAVATLLGMFCSSIMGWTLLTGLVFGLCLSTASTVVLLRALEERQLHSDWLAEYLVLQVPITL